MRIAPGVKFTVNFITVAPMSSSSANQGTPLSERIYVELVARAILPGADGTTPKLNPAHLAKLSIKFAEAFRAEEKSLSDAAKPDTGKYDVSMADITKWDK